MESSTTHLPPWLQQAMRAPGPTRVEFADSGYVSVFPDQRRYASNIQNLADPSLWTAKDPGFRPLPDHTIGADGRPLDQLHWALTLQRLRSQPQAFDFQYRMVRLLSWPALAYLPEEDLPAVARICALLARKPTTASLIPLTLGLPEDQVFPLLEALRLNGHLQVAGVPAGQDSAPAAAPQPASATEVNGSAPSSLIGKLWQRLALRGQG